MKKILFFNYTLFLRFFQLFAPFFSYFFIKKSNWQILFLMKYLKLTLLWIAIILGSAIVAFSVYFFTVTAGVRLQAEKLAVSGVCIRVFDDENQPVCSTATGDNSALYDQIAPSLVHAFVATEDRRFFFHNGFDFRRMCKALFKNVTSLSLKEGASTISQQLIKNTHLTGEKTIKRKLQEIKLTAQLERKYSKEEIMQKYLNTIYFGHNAFGVCDAARFYFDCDPKELTVAQSAMLAGLARSPNNYSPFKHPQKCLSRRNAVLNFMKQEGYIDESVYRAALLEPLPLHPTNLARENAYCQYVYNELESLMTKLGQEINGELLVQTYLQTDKQATLTKCLEEAKSNKVGGILDNRRGGYLAFYSDVGDIRRTPASTLKPLAVYAPAVEEDILLPATPILDEKINFSGYSPKNYDGQYHGYVSARESLAKSLNIPAVKTLNALTLSKSCQYLEKLGLPAAEQDKSLALALGGVSEGYTLPQLLSAYSTFACEGNFAEGAFIKSVSRNGKTIYQHHPTRQSVFSEETSFLINDMLRDSVKYGTAKKLRALPFQIAAKTGTAGTAQKNTDAYAIAYTHGYTTGVWLGNADNAPIEEVGGGMPCKFLFDINEYLYKQGEDFYFQNFTKPREIVKVALDKIAYETNHELLYADPLSAKENQLEEYFKSSNLPQKQSTIFSNPLLPTPNIRYQQGKVIISFAQYPPLPYQYKIEREVDKKKKTLYFGDFQREFIDDDLVKGKNYIYTITPYLEGKAGTAVTLPTVTTKDGTLQAQPPTKIMKTPWWQT